jgi:hypothetical protein
MVTRHRFAMDAPRLEDFVRRMSPGFWRRWLAARAPLYIIYSSKDGHHADPLRARLQTWGYRDVFLDREDIVAGQKWRDELLRYIVRSHGAVVVCTANLAQAKWCNDEVGSFQKRGLRLFPVVFESDLSKLPFGLVEDQAVRALTDPELKALKKGLAGLWSPRWRTASRLGIGTLILVLLGCLVNAGYQYLAVRHVQRDRDAGWPQQSTLADFGAAALDALDQEVFRKDDLDGVDYAMAQIHQIASSHPAESCDLLIQVYSGDRRYSWGIQELVALGVGQASAECPQATARSLRQGMQDRWHEVNSVLTGRHTRRWYHDRVKQRPQAADLNDLARLCRALRAPAGISTTCGKDSHVSN